MEGLSPNFSKHVNNYTLTVGNNISKLNLSYAAGHSKAKVTVSGNNNFAIGNNTVKITVTAENGYNRTYSILVTKADDPTKADAFLDNLIVENFNLEDGFQTEKLEYNLGDISIEKLNVLAYPKTEGANVEILGIDNLIDGENVITIKVTAIDTITTKEYKIKFNNTLPKKEEVVIYDNLVNTENNEEKHNSNSEFTIWFKENGLYVLLLLAMFLEFAQILYMYNKLNKKDINKDFDEEDKEQDFNDLKPSGDVLEKINKEKEEISNVLKNQDKIDYSNTEEDKVETLESILKKRRNID